MMTFFKKVLSFSGTVLAVLLTAVPAGAQNPQQLGENHAHRRVQVNHRYLLLPVQEREDLATIVVMADNRQLQSLNVRLAVDKVDYYVPLDIRRFGQGSLLLDITFRGDRRNSGAMPEIPDSLK